MVKTEVSERGKGGKKSEIVPVMNRNVLTLERHLDLLNSNDEDHIFLECIKDNFESLYR